LNIQVMLIETPPHDDRLRLNSLDACVGRLSSSKRWFFEAPVTFVLNEGRVTRVIKYFDDLDI